MFYNRLKEACEMRNIAITTAAKAVLPSSGVVDNWKKGGHPRIDALVKFAEYLGVSTDYLLELTDNPQPTSATARDLSEEEARLVDGLRGAELKVRETVYTMVFAALHSPERKVPFLNANDRKAHHTEAEMFKKRVEGEAAAGTPITAVPEQDISVLVPEKYLSERYFVVRAQGDSMIDAGIPSGSYCVFTRDVTVDNGSIVLAQIEGPTDQPEDTIKRIFLHGKQIELRSENPVYEPMFFPAEAVQVSGLFVAVL